MKVSFLLISLTDMVSYSRTKKTKKGHIMAQKRKNRAQKALYRLDTIKKFTAVKRTIILPSASSARPERISALTKQQNIAC